MWILTPGQEIFGKIKWTKHRVSSAEEICQSINFVPLTNKMGRSSWIEPEFRVLMTLKLHEQRLKEANLLPKFNIQYKHHCSIGWAPCKAKGIRIPDSGFREILLVECGIWENFAVESRIVSFGIWNTVQGIRILPNDWNPESKFHQQETGIAGLESGIRNPRRGIRNSRQSWIPLHRVIGYNDKTWWNYQRCQR